MQQKIFLLTPDFSPQRGGVARYLDAIKKTFPDNIGVLHVKKLPKTIKLAGQIARFSKNHDAVWTSHVLPIGTAAMLSSMKTKIPYTVFLHGLDFDLARRSWLKRLITKLVLKHAQHIVANSRALADELEDFTGRSDVLVVYPTVGDDLIEQAKRNPLKIKHRKTRLLTIGRLVKRKGHIKVIEAIIGIPDVEYLIVGDGPEKTNIENKIKELHLEDRVFIKTDVEDKNLADTYLASDIFVMPTSKTKLDREGFGIVYLEAQLFRVPVIATTHPGVNEAVIHKGTGLLIEDNPAALKHALECLIGDPELRQRMGEAGREFVLAGFTREKQMRKLEVIL